MTELNHEGLEATFRCPWDKRGEVGYALLCSEYPWPKTIPGPTGGLPVVTETTTEPDGDGWALITAKYGLPQCQSC